MRKGLKTVLKRRKMQFKDNPLPPVVSLVKRPPEDCKHGGKHGPWTTTYMGASCDTCGYFTQD